MVSTSYPVDLQDWRGLFIRHKADALARRPDIALKLWAPPGEHHEAVDVAADVRESSWLAQLMRQGGIAHRLRTAGLAGVGSALVLLALLRRAYRRNTDVDLYHVNWLQNVLPLPADGKPLLVTVLGSDLQLLKIPGMTTLLRRVFRGRPVVICPNASWMMSLLQGAFGDVASVRFCPFGIDAGWYSIGRQLDPDQPPRWLCVTRLTRAKLGSLLEWGEGFFAYPGRELHLFGPMQEQVELPTWVRYHGAVAPDALMRDWFPKAHGLITLSRHAEGRPQVMLEAMAAGLPIIASSLPAHENTVVDGSTGCICASPEEVRAALDRFEDAEENRRAGAEARELMSREVGTWDDCAERYRVLYRRLYEGEAQA